MFTGIIYHIGLVKSFSKKLDGALLKIESSLFKNPKTGASFAINGVCLTLCEFSNNVGFFDLSEETLRVTNLGSLRENEQVHLESSLLAGSELGGHFVQGHVDFKAKILEVLPTKLRVELPGHLEKYAVEKGCIAIDGVSLTLAKVKGCEIEIALVPHTWDNTLFKEKNQGDFVNIEMDMFAKMVYKQTQGFNINQKVELTT